MVAKKDILSNIIGVVSGNNLCIYIIYITYIIYISHIDPVPCLKNPIKNKLVTSKWQPLLPEENYTEIT